MKKEIIDSFRKMKLLYNHARFRLYKNKVEDLPNDYEELKKLREDIQFKYFRIYDELTDEKLIEGELDADMWGLNRDQEKEMWNAELRLMNDIKKDFDIAISMIESDEAEQSIIEAKNW